MKVPAGLAYLHPDSIALRLLPPTDRPKCPKGQCYSYLVNVDENERRWRCVRCLHYTVHELRPRLF